MGIELKWDVDAADEQTQPGAVGSRGRRRPWKGLARLVILFLVLALVTAGFYLRLREVDAQQANLLRASVEAEITALRLGDVQAYQEFQDSEDPARQLVWREVFDAWQRRKIESNALAGEIVALAISGEDAWVQVEEIINGEDWLHTWFYRRSGDGWLHVSPQAGWRGQARSHRSGRLRIEYDDIDAPLVSALAPLLESWLENGCQLLNCASVPALNVQILARPGAAVWSTGDSWLLLLPSPTAGLVRQGDALPGGPGDESVKLLAQRLVREIAGKPESDWSREAGWLHASAGALLADRMLPAESGQHLLQSLSTTYGDDALSALIEGLEPDSTLELVAMVAGVADLHDAALDWRDLLTWQLEQESVTRLAGDSDGFLALYDLRDDALGVLARARLVAGEFIGPPSIEEVTPVSAADGSALLRARVRDASGAVPVYFRLVEGRWLRAS
ncbi:MAG: hypothetical protein OXF63_00500 [Anaerolineaceae bacterium]|nr:hypothetical protein [Anaerolineaceae bacterium]